MDESAVALDAKVDVVELELRRPKLPPQLQRPKLAQQLPVNLFWDSPPHQLSLQDRPQQTVPAVQRTATPCVETGRKVLAAPRMGLVSIVSCEDI